MGHGSVFLWVSGSWVTHCLLCRGRLSETGDRHPSAGQAGCWSLLLKVSLINVTYTWPPYLTSGHPLPPNWEILEPPLDIHAEYGIRKKVTRTTTDNGANFVKAFQSLPTGHGHHHGADQWSRRGRLWRWCAGGCRRRLCTQRQRLATWLQPSSAPTVCVSHHELDSYDRCRQSRGKSSLQEDFTIGIWQMSGNVKQIWTIGNNS